MVLQFDSCSFEMGQNNLKYSAVHIDGVEDQTTINNLNEHM